MKKSFYISSMKMNSLIAETVISGYHIVVDGLTYELVSRRPRNKRVIRKLSGVTTEEEITIYG